MFKLPPLPYSESALEPAMSRETLATHHGKHHAGYIKKMNAALAERADPPASVEAVVRLAAREKNQSLFNNAAQAWNHAFFWMSMTPQSQSGPEGTLKAALEAAFKSLDAFRDEFVSQGSGHFASGWLWLIADKKGVVSLRDMHDAQTPIVDAGLTPLMVCDLWEHAYYLDHKNERGAFLKGFIGELAHWRFAESQYQAAKSGEAGWRFP